VVANAQGLTMAGADANAIALIGGAGQALATPSAVGSDGDSFSVSRPQSPRRHNEALGCASPAGPRARRDGRAVQSALLRTAWRGDVV
jgi:hypothetical protein